MGGEKFLVGLRGAKNFSIAFRIVFRILFRVFQTVFSYRFKNFSGANSFCTRAALKEWPAFRRKRDFHEPLLTAMAQVLYAGHRRLVNGRALNGGLDPWGVGSANLGHPFLPHNLPENACFKGIWGNFEAKMGRPPNLQIQRPTDPTPHLKPSESWKGTSLGIPGVYSQTFHESFGTAYDWTKKSLDGTRWQQHFF